MARSTMAPSKTVRAVWDGVATTSTPINVSGYNSIAVAWPDPGGFAGTLMEVQASVEENGQGPWKNITDGLGGKLNLVPDLGSVVAIVDSDLKEAVQAAGFIRYVSDVVEAAGTEVPTLCGI